MGSICGKRTTREKAYLWYPRLKNGEPNLNPWWAVSYRRINQWCRRGCWKLRPRRYRELLAEQACVASPDILTGEARKRLGELLWILGRDTPYRFTPAQAERQRQLAREILAEIRREKEEEDRK
jgi:hypothetical protein